VERGFVIYGYLFAGAYVAQGVELYVAVKNFHEGVRLAGMIDVVRAVAACASVQTPSSVNTTDAEHAPPGSPALGFGGRDFFSGVVCNLFAASEPDGRKAASAVDRRFFDSQSVCKFHIHRREQACAEMRERILVLSAIIRQGKNLRGLISIEVRDFN
jgi:hypothetical protein